MARARMTLPSLEYPVASDLAFPVGLAVEILAVGISMGDCDGVAVVQVGVAPGGRGDPVDTSADTEGATVPLEVLMVTLMGAAVGVTVALFPVVVGLVVSFCCGKRVAVEFGPDDGLAVVVASETGLTVLDAGLVVAFKPSNTAVSKVQVAGQFAASKQAHGRGREKDVESVSMSGIWAALHVSVSEQSLAAVPKFGKHGAAK
jgi:hypothetical protein